MSANNEYSVSELVQMMIESNGAGETLESSTTVKVHSSATDSWEVTMKNGDTLTLSGTATEALIKAKKYGTPLVIVPEIT
jgi:hypothetical protein